MNHAFRVTVQDADAAILQDMEAIAGPDSRRAIP